MKTEDGFSLVEIMVAVSIVGILAVIAVPNYLKSVNIAKQVEAKANLTSLVAAEKTFFTQFSVVTSRLDEVGWHPSGLQSYGYGFTSDYPAAGVISSPPYSAADTTCFDTYTNDTTCMAGFSAKWQNGPGVKGAASFSAPSFPVGAAWHAYARGNLGNAVDDEWKIDSYGNLTNTSNGI